MTVCNMSIEGGARAGHGRARRHDVRVPRRPRVRADRARPGTRRSRAGASCRPTRARRYDKSVTLDAAALEPMITYGTNPGHGHADHGPRSRSGRRSAIRPSAPRSRRRSPTWACSRASRCSASRSTSSSSAAARTRASPTCARRPAVMKGRKVAPGVRVLVVPGSQDGQEPGRGRGARPRSSSEAGAEWREAGLLDVHRHERRPARARPVRRQHQQPQLRGPAGQGRAHVPRLAAHRRRGRRHRQGHRRPDAARDGG